MRNRSVLLIVSVYKSIVYIRWRRMEADPCPASQSADTLENRLCWSPTWVIFYCRNVQRWEWYLFHRVGSCFPRRVSFGESDSEVEPAYLILKNATGPDLQPRRKTYQVNCRVKFSLPEGEGKVWWVLEQCTSHLQSPCS